MGLLDLAGGLLKQYLNATPGQANAAAASQHFDTVAQQATPDLLSRGLSAVFQSDQTPEFAQLAAQMFSQATPEQKQALLAQLQSLLGPTAGALGGPAQNIQPGALQSALQQAQTTNPSIVDKVSQIYAQHPTLIKTLGGAALTIALAKMAEHARGA
jgi:hypothetical protein